MHLPSNQINFLSIIAYWEIRTYSIPMNRSHATRAAANYLGDNMSSSAVGNMATWWHTCARIVVEFVHIIVKRDSDLLVARSFCHAFGRSICFKWYLTAFNTFTSHPYASASRSLRNHRNDSVSFVKYWNCLPVGHFLRTQIRIKHYRKWQEKLEKNTLKIHVELVCFDFLPQFPPTWSGFRCQFLANMIYDAVHFYECARAHVLAPMNVNNGQINESNAITRHWCAMQA